jgi:hypothetical protein
MATRAMLHDRALPRIASPPPCARRAEPLESVAEPAGIVILPKKKAVAPGKTDPIPCACWPLMMRSLWWATRNTGR